MPDIRQNNRVVTQITTVKMRPDNQDEVLALMKERARFMARQPGFVSVSLHRSEDGTHVVNLRALDRQKGALPPHTTRRIPQEVAEVRRARPGRRAGAL